MLDSVQPDVHAAAQRLHTIADNLRDASGQLDQVIAENRQDIRSFARDGLPEIERFVREGRAAAQDIRALAGSLRENPTQLLYRAARARRGDSAMKPAPAVRLPHLAALLPGGCAALLLSGCSGLLHSSAPPEQTYYLRAPAVAGTAAPGTDAAGTDAAGTDAASVHSSGVSLRVGHPVADPGLDSPRTSCWCRPITA